MNKIILVLAIALTVLTGCSKHSELHESMETMGDTFKAMKNSEDANAVKAELNSFLTAIEIAVAQQVKPEDQAEFDKGMEQVRMLSAQLGAALQANDMETVNALLEKLGEVRKEYHDKLGVK